MTEKRRLTGKMDGKLSDRQEAFKQKRKTDSLEANSMIVLALTMCANVLGVLFQSLAGHLLQDTGLFADLNAVMALFNILVLPTTVSSCLIAKYTAVLHAQHEIGKIKSFFFGMIKVLGILALLFSGIMAAAHEAIGKWLHIEDSMVIILAVALAAVTLFSAVFTGGLQGSKAFVLYGVFGLIGPVFKIAAIAASLLFQRKIAGILAVWLFGTLFSYIVGIFLIKKVLGKHKREKAAFDKREMGLYILKLIVANAGVILISNIDVLMVKHNFNAEAGLYSGARMLGYSITYLTNTFVIVLFPMVAGSAGEEKKNRQLLKKVLVYNVILSIAAVFFLMLFSDLCIKLLLGKEFLMCRQYLVPITAYALPIGILNLLANYGMAKNSTTYITASMFLGGALAIAGGMIWKESLLLLIWFLALVMWAAVFCNLLYIYRQGRKPEDVRTE